MLETDVAEALTVPDVAEAPTVPDVVEAPTVQDVQVSDLQGGAGVDAHVGRFQSRRDCRVGSVFLQIFHWQLDRCRSARGRRRFQQLLGLRAV